MVATKSRYQHSFSLTVEEETELQKLISKGHKIIDIFRDGMAIRDEKDK